MAKKKKTTRRRTTATRGGGASLLASLDRAIEDASRRAFKEALSVLPGSTQVGRFLDQIASSPYLEHLRELTLAELAEAIRTAPAGVARRVAGRRPSGRVQRAKRGRPRKYNTRTAKGREQIDRAIAEFLAQAGTASAEEIRAEVGGTAAQVRESLGRLIKAKKVTKSGQRRGTRYNWVG